MKIDLYRMLKTILFTIKNGKSLSSGIELLSSTADTKKDRKIYTKINDDLKDGKTFSEALSKHQIGTLDVIQFISMAEKGVSFKNALEKIIIYLEVKERFQRESSDQTSLPFIYITISALVVLGIKFYAIPMQMEKAAGYSPEMIKLISGHLELAQIFTDSLFIFLIVFASYFFILLTSLFGQSRTVQTVSKTISLQLPFTSKIILKFEKFMLFSMLGEMLQSGISFKNSMSSALNTTTVYRFKHAIKKTLYTIKHDGKLVYHNYLYDNVERALLTGVGSSKQIGEVLTEISSRSRSDAMVLSTKFFRMVTLISIFMMAFAVFIEFYTVVLTQILIQKGLIDASKGLKGFG
ncbi:type II secretion system F family protein [Sulfurimonas sp.]|nr:type II secretion system F family protein [Sulfurimonas sp.]